MRRNLQSFTPRSLSRLKEATPQNGNNWLSAPPTVWSLSRKNFTEVEVWAYQKVRPVKYSVLGWARYWSCARVVIWVCSIFFIFIIVDLEIKHNQLRFLKSKFKFHHRIWKWWKQIFSCKLYISRLIAHSSSRPRFAVEERYRRNPCS